jgi:hypothetical protein
LIFLIDSGGFCMAILVIPEVLRRFSETSDTLELNLPIHTLSEFSEWIEANHPRLHQVIFQTPSSSDQSQSQKKKMNGFINLYMENCAVTHQLSEPIPITPSSSLRLVTSISGG